MATEKEMFKFSARRNAHRQAWEVTQDQENIKDEIFSVDHQSGRN